jgi:hypothetical protein
MHESSRRRDQYSELRVTCTSGVRGRESCLRMFVVGLVKGLYPKPTICGQAQRTSRNGLPCPLRLTQPTKNGY